MIDVILVFCLVSADFFHLRCWQYISQYFYPIVEGIIRFSLRNIKVNLIFQILAFVSDIPDTDIFLVLMTYLVYVHHQWRSDELCFFQFLLVSLNVFVRLNLLMLKISYSMPIIALLREDETLFSLKGLSW